MKIRVLNHYRSRNIEYAVGQTIEVSESEGEHLLRDAPGCFKVLWGRVEQQEPQEPEEKELENPPVDKVIHRYQPRTK